MPDLTRLLSPRSIAVIGASATPGAPGNDAVRNVLRHSRLNGPVFLVNPGREEIEGHPCLSSIDQLPQDQVDTALVIVGAGSVVEAVENCAKRGVKYAIIPSGGLGETGQAGRIEEAKLRAVADQWGIRLYGPNCPGLTNLNDRVFLSVSPGAAHDTIGGRIGLVTQGGALGRNVMQYGDRNVGIGCWLSAGNEVDLELCDFVEHLNLDDRISTIACIIEGFRDGRRFLQAAEAANAAGKPVVAMVLGCSASGARAAQSHTAHMATTGRVVRSLLRQHGVTVVDDIDELVEQAALFDRGVRPAGTAPCVMSFSGGAAVAATDALELEGITPAALSAATRERIGEVMPTFGVVANPLDLTMEAMRRFEIVSGAVSALADDPGVNTLIVTVPGDYGDITARFVQEALAFEGADRHVLAIWSSPRRGAGCTELESRGILPFGTAGGMARALARAHVYRSWLHRRSLTTASGGAPHPVRSNTTRPQQMGNRPLSEYEAKRLLAEYGVAIPAGELCGDRASAAAAASRLGFPVALKIQSALLPHKTEAGGVLLGVHAADDAAAGWQQIMSSAVTARIDPRSVQGVLVEQMASPGTDLIVSVRHDPNFGRISAVGVGGIFTEVLDDIVFLSGVPGVEELAAALRTLVGWPIFAGSRGCQAVDLRALSELLNTLNALAEQEGLDEIEINPLRATSQDGTLVALDALATKSTAALSGER